MFNSESHLGRTAAESITIIYHQTAAIQSTNQSPHYDRLPQPSTPYQATNIFPNIRLHAGGVFQYTGSDPMILSLETLIIHYMNVIFRDSPNCLGDRRQDIDRPEGE